MLFRRVIGLNEPLLADLEYFVLVFQLPPLKIRLGPFCERGAVMLGLS